MRTDWDLGGAVGDGVLLYRTGLAVAQGAAYPEWKPGTEFRYVRELQLKSKPIK